MPLEVTEYEDLPEWLLQRLHDAGTPYRATGSEVTAEEDEAAHGSV